MHAEIRLAEIATIIDCEHKTVRTVPAQEAYGFAVGTPSLRTDRIDYSQAKPVDRVTFNEWSQRTELGVGDIIFAREAPAGGLGWVDGSKNVCLGQRTVCIRAQSELIDSRYLYYKLHDPEIQQAITKMSAGSTVHHINVSDIKELEISHIPDLNTQKRISKLLGDIDRLIDLNDLMVANYTNILKTVFYYWFIQFDYPDKFRHAYKISGGVFKEATNLQFSIPEAFAEVQLNTICNIDSGYSFKPEDYVTNGKYGVVTIKNVQNGFLDTEKISSVNTIPEGLSPTSILGFGDILMSLTGNVGRLCLVDEDNLLLNQRVGKILCLDLYRNFLYCHFLRDDTRKRLENLAGGSSQANLSPLQVTEDFLALPPKELLVEFNEVVNPILKSILSRNESSRVLRTMKNSLLPVLMNGHVLSN